MNIIKTIGYTKKFFRRPDMYVDFFRRPGIGMPKNCANKLDRDAFFVQGRGEVMAECMRPESRYPGVLSQTFTKPVQAAS